MIIQLRDLKPQLPRSMGTRDDFIAREFLGLEYSGGRRSQAHEFVSTSLTGDMLRVYHGGFMQYLAVAYNQHFGIVIRPDMLWYDLLCELASIVKASPEAYRSMFTDTPDKKLLVVPSDDPTDLPLDRLIDLLRDSIPTDTSAFFPEFTTSEPDGQKAQWAAFADMASPFYDYATTACGIPFVDLRGSLDDWKKFETLTTLHLFPRFLERDPDLADFFERWTVTIRMIRGSMDPEAEGRLDEASKNHFWSHIFTRDNLMSGSEASVDGWYSYLFREEPTIKKAEAFPSHLSKVEYRQLENKQDFIMFQGIMSSLITGNALFPYYGQVIVEKRQAPRALVGSTYYDMAGFKVKAAAKSGAGFDGFGPA